MSSVVKLNDFSTSILFNRNKFVDEKYSESAIIRIEKHYETKKICIIMHLM